MSDAPSERLLTQALSGDRDALAELLVQLRPYLTTMARRGLDPILNARVDAADIVQETCLESCRDFASFRGSSMGELINWLRMIQSNNIRQAKEVHLGTKKRSAFRESAQPTDDQAELVHTIPSQQTSIRSRAMRGELAIRLATELELLPDDQREAIRLRYLEGKSLAELADRFGRTETAVAGLLKRGLRALRDRFCRTETQ